MLMRLLEKNESTEIKNRLNIVWDIQHNYWYPLFPCDREDIIAFDSEYIENSDKLQVVKKLLMEHGVKDVYEFRENGISNEIIDIFHYEFWISDSYFWNNECFWFDENMDWIIYISHEGTTTFGGKWLVEELKRTWTHWKSNTLWDTKN